MKSKFLIPFLTVLMMLWMGMSKESVTSCATASVDQRDIQLKTSAEGWTAEQMNLKRRAELASDPNKIWWIYCLADNGQVVYYGAVKGKVTSSHKYIEGVDYQGIDVRGESDDYVYWFDPMGVYYQWNGQYFLTSIEQRIATPVLNFRSVQ
jgi:hypothetical protein